MPLPGLPLLLAAGALIGAGAMHPAGAIALAVAAAVLADLLWYELGRHRGSQAPRLVCRVSLEPDSCVRRTQDVFMRHGVRSLLFARFVPALGTVTAVLVGMLSVGWCRFLLHDGLGALLWAGGYMGLGCVFSDQLEALATLASRAGTALAVMLLGTLEPILPERTVPDRCDGRHCGAPRVGSESGYAYQLSGMAYARQAIGRNENTRRAVARASASS